MTARARTVLITVLVIALLAIIAADGSAAHWLGGLIEALLQRGWPRESI
ncbi:MAG: hypothetical protein J0H54_06685 [Rhizobiales bacterium]|nr:hypothetical protein [Hyphomicrobiales bacterium]